MNFIPSLLESIAGLAANTDTIGIKTIEIDKKIAL
jgi:hypothetical protein